MYFTPPLPAWQIGSPPETIGGLSIAELRGKQRRAFLALVAVRPSIGRLIGLVCAGDPPTGQPQYGRRLMLLQDRFEAALDGLDGSLIRLAWFHLAATFSDRVFMEVMEDE